MSCPQLDAQAVSDYSACVQREVQSMHEQHEQLLRQIEELSAQVIDPLTGAVKALPDVCERLEAAFQRIDELNAFLDRVNADIIAMHKTVRGILDAPNFSEKASSFFSKLSFGGGDAASKSKQQQSGVWKRVPETLVVGGNAIEVFMEDFHHSIASANSAAAALRKH
jgi:hypothetical protein